MIITSRILTHEEWYECIAWIREHNIEWTCYSWNSPYQFTLITDDAKLITYAILKWEAKPEKGIRAWTIEDDHNPQAG